jgi:hypothetical protein
MYLLLYSTLLHLPSLDSTLSDDVAGRVADPSVMEPEPEPQEPGLFALAEPEPDLDPDPTYNVIKESKKNKK